ncbi:hypothetical protein FQA47_011889 [Oryzias melastigma]|uniref:Uncharacterized protein n=1 Tax=Oryzias melastigma TaxID=30732 RepID=A0A834FA58_ORYME|nr:hypothetical protein FQA47_011889 [Oryzias melastigma]
MVDSGDFHGLPLGPEKSSRSSRIPERIPAKLWASVKKKSSPSGGSRSAETRNYLLQVVYKPRPHPSRTPAEAHLHHVLCCVLFAVFLRNGLLLFQTVEFPSRLTCGKGVSFTFQVVLCSERRSSELCAARIHTAVSMSLFMRALHPLWHADMKAHAEDEHGNQKQTLLELQTFSRSALPLVDSTNVLNLVSLWSRFGPKA